MTKNPSSAQPVVDAEALRDQVKLKYRDVATNPEQEFHFHTGRVLTQRLKYDEAITSQIPDQAVESFAGVSNPFSLRDLQRGEKVVDLGSGAGFDCFVASALVGEEGEVVGVDMTDEMLSKSRALADDMGLNNIEFRDGLLEELPVEDAWADVAISNGVINLCSDKKKAMAEIYRILKPGGYLQFADIANSKPVPQAAVENIDLWTA
ncbi:MAG: arsenite methyltransferase [Pseudohongiellaceae bacterium]|jgi:arsenite methyltransferase